MAAARIGEILVQDGVITAEAREKALRSQAVHGGRLGTNLVEQFALGLDELAEGLARQHDMPAALDRHFSQADPSVQARLAPALAARWRVVPLGRLPSAGKRERVAVAVLDPPSIEALDELGDGLAAEAVPAVAPELRVLYHLERVYGIERANRFKRGPRRAGLPLNERRSFVRTLSDVEYERLDGSGSLARIEVRRVERTRTGEIETLTDLAMLVDSLMAIKRASGRTRVAELLVGALEQGFDRLFTVGLLLTVRSGLLLGWKGFARGRDPGFMEGVGGVAVPLHAPSLFAEPCRTGRPYFGPPPGGGTELDHKLWRFLGAGEPAAVGVHPLAVFGQFATAIYLQAPREIPAAAEPAVAELGAALGTALERLVHTDEER